MLRKYLVAMLLLSATAAMSQQQEYSPATIYTDSGSVSGYVVNDPHEATPQVFRFSTTMQGQETTYTTANIKRVELADGSLFERHMIDVAVIEDREMERRADQYGTASYFKGKALVEKIVSGPVSLYRFIDRYSHLHFFVTENADTALTPLPYEPFFDPVRSVMRRSLDYQNILSRIAVTAGCPASTVKLSSSVVHETRPLINYIQKLNACRGTQGKVNGSLNKKSFNAALGVMVAGVYRQTSVNSKGGFLTASGSAVSPMIGGFIDLLPSRQNTKMAFGVGVGLMSYKRVLDVSYAYPARGVVHMRQESNGAAISLDLSARAMLGHGILRPFVEGGSDVRLLLSNKYREKSEMYNGIITDVIRNDGEPIEWTVLAGVGLQSKRGSLHIRGHYALANSDYYMISASIRIRIRP
jgi:hypothetical protein